MADDINGVSAELVEALRRLNTSIRDSSDALDESTSTSTQNQRALVSEFEKLGLTVKGDNTLLSTHAERTKERIKLEQEVNEQLKASGRVRQDASNAEIESYKLTQRRNMLYDSELASLGRVIDSNGKITKSQIELEGAQKRTIAAIKKEEETRNRQEQGLNNFVDMLKALPQQAVLLALNQAFDTFAAGVTGAYKASIAYQDALLAGTRGMRVDAAATAAKMQEMAKVTAKLGSSLSGMGDQFVTVGVGLAFLGGPLGILAGILSVIIGIAFKFEGLQKEQEAAMQERNAELVKKQAEINDKLAAGFTKLGEATMTGADGMTGLRDRLYSMTLAITDLESFNKVLIENKKNLALLGGTMMEGVKSFSVVASDLIRSSLGKTLEDMGIGVEEMMAHTAQFMAYQNRLGLKTTGDVSKATGEYILELDKLAAITGTSRKEQEEARETILKEQKVQAALMIAEQNNDTKEIERLKAVIGTAALMKSAGMGKDAADFALRQAMGGTITDAGTARSAMISGGKGGADDLMRNGERDVSKIYASLLKGMMGVEKPMLGSTLVAGTNQLGQSDLYAMNNAIKGLAKFQQDFAEAKKKDPKLTEAEFYESQRKVTDSWRQGQVTLERKQREEQQAEEKAILAGQMDTMAKAFQAPADGMMGAAYKMWDAVRDFAIAVAEFMKNPLDNAKTLLTGKDKSQRDAENLTEKQKELKDTEEKIKDLKESLDNPEKAKKIAAAKFEIAEKELKLKEQAYDELKKKMAPGYWKPGSSDEEKRTIAKEKEKIAIQASTVYLETQEAKKRLEIAKKALSNTETGFFSKSAETKQRELKSLEQQRAGLQIETGNLERAVQSNPASKTSVGFSKTYGANYKGSGMLDANGKPTAAAMGSNSGMLPYRFAADNAGGESAFNQIDPKLREAVIAAASEYYERSGGKQLIINSSLRDAKEQQKLWDTSVRAGTPGTQPNGMTVARPGTSPHEQGRAVDIQNYNDPMALFALRNAGLRQTEGSRDPVHFQRGAFSGGIFSGPKSGYPVELHGREAIVPLPNFGDTVSVENSQSSSKSSLSSVMGGNSSGNDFVMMMGDMFSMMENKLDDMIDKLDTGNNYSDKLVKAMV
jgi:hypothetical protein